MESDPDKKVDFGGPIFSDASNELIGTTYEGDKRRIYWRNKAWEADYNMVRSKLPGREVRLPPHLIAAR